MPKMIKIESCEDCNKACRFRDYSSKNLSPDCPLDNVPVYAEAVNEEMRAELEIRLQEYCGLCVRLNPQHEDCYWCEGTRSWRELLTRASQVPPPLPTAEAVNEEMRAWIEKVQATALNVIKHSLLKAEANELLSRAAQVPKSAAGPWQKSKAPQSRILADFGGVLKVITWYSTDPPDFWAELYLPEPGKEGEG